LSEFHVVALNKAKVLTLRTLDITHGHCLFRLYSIHWQQTCSFLRKSVVFTGIQEDERSTSFSILDKHGQGEARRWR
jgi:hypothetical protein